MTPRLSLAQIDELAAAGRLLRHAESDEQRRQIEASTVRLAQRFHEANATWIEICRHLGVSPTALLKLRQRRTAHTPTTPFVPPPAPVVRLSFEPDGGTRSGYQLDLSQSSSSLSSTSTLGHTLSAQGSAFLTGERNGVFVALGLAENDHRSALRLTQEAKTISRPFPGHRVPTVRHDTTRAELQDMAVRRPFILHIAAHRSMGATGLANSRGEVERSR